MSSITRFIVLPPQERPKHNSKQHEHALPKKCAWADDSDAWGGTHAQTANLSLVLLLAGCPAYHGGSAWTGFPQPRLPETERPFGVQQGLRHIWQRSRSGGKQWRGGLSLDRCGGHEESRNSRPVGGTRSLVGRV